MDVKALIGEVAARNGIRLEPNDPAFALVTLNQLVLEKAIQDMVAQIRDAAADFESSAKRVQARAGIALAQEVNQIMDRLKHDANRDSGVPARPPSLRWAAIGVLLSAALFTAGIWIGHAFWPGA